MASRTVRARLDAESERALERLLRDGGTESEVLRAALVEAAARRWDDAVIREQAERIGNDPADRAEMQALVAELEPLSPEWPEW